MTILMLLLDVDEVGGFVLIGMIIVLGFILIKRSREKDE